MLTRITPSNGVVSWQSPLLAAVGTPHAFSTRIGGVSAPPFASLNLGNPASCDSPDTDEHLQENYSRLQTAIAPGRPMLRAWASQVHGVRVIQIESEPEAEYAESLEAMIADRFHGQIEADGMLTDIPRLFLTVRVADCVPLLFADGAGRMVAAVHAGWRGVVGNIVSRTIRAFGECDIMAAGVRVAIGPHIGVAHFEVGPEVAEAFGKADLAQAIRYDLGVKPHIDLQAALQMQLNRLGVRQIDGTDQCTAANAADFFSHRRDKGITGRQAAVIAPRPEP
jgi:YfiH family protein